MLHPDSTQVFKLQSRCSEIWCLIFKVWLSISFLCEPSFIVEPNFFFGLAFYTLLSKSLLVVFMLCDIVYGFVLFSLFIYWVFVIGMFQFVMSLYLGKFLLVL